MKLAKYILKKENIFLLIIFFIFLYKIDFPRKFYNLIALDYNKRIVKHYGYCSAYSSGFIQNIYQKYEIKDLNIIQYSGSRNPYWIIPKIKKDSNNNFIFINYNLINDFKLTNIGRDKFKYNFTYLNNNKKIDKISFLTLGINNLKEIEISNDNQKIFKLNVEDIKFKNIDNNYYEINLTKEIIDNFYKNKFSEVNYYFRPKYKLDKKDLKVMEIKIHFKNIFDLKKFKIIEQFDNCYFAKRNL